MKQIMKGHDDVEKRIIAYNETVFKLNCKKNDKVRF